jgi:death on curing protein
MQEIRFLFLEEVVRIHADQITLFGGMQGIRDYRLLESALYEPQASYNSRYLYQDIFAMSSAYAYGIIKNHPFIDGNKRTGIVSALTFLEYNGYEINLSQNQLYKLAISIATSKTAIPKVASVLKKHTIAH